MRTIAFSRQRDRYDTKMTVFEGRRYHSALECCYARELERQKQAEEIFDYIPQFKMELYVGDILVCNYYIDFKVHCIDGNIEFHEVKGMETEMWGFKWRLAMGLYGKENFVLIK